MTRVIILTVLIAMVPLFAYAQDNGAKRNLIQNILATNDKIQLGQDVNKLRKIRPQLKALFSEHGSVHNAEHKVLRETTTLGGNRAHVMYEIRNGTLSAIIVLRVVKEDSIPKARTKLYHTFTKRWGEPDLRLVTWRREGTIKYLAPLLVWKLPGGNVYLTVPADFDFVQYLQVTIQVHVTQSEVDPSQYFKLVTLDAHQKHRLYRAAKLVN